MRQQLIRKPVPKPAPRDLDLRTPSGRPSVLTGAPELRNGATG